MRIITGEYKGRRLRGPEDNSVRPTADKVKEALFSIIADKLWGSRVLDLFAGTGSLGLEALSRGAESCLFGDNSRESLKIIKSNIEMCGAGQKAEVMAGDYRKVLMNAKGQFDIIFLDPPYGKGFLEKSITLIGEEGLLKEGGLIIAEHRKEEELPETVQGFYREKERKYGIVKLSIYVHEKDLPEH